jgi:nicotinamide-nucleotide amidase
MISDAELRRLALRVGVRLMRRGQQLVSAESCTGGWIAKCVTDIAGSSQWFDQAWVTYSNAAKQSQLGVAASILTRHGAVSEATVRAMVKGAMRRSQAEFAVAVSGIAGPGGAVPGKPVGTVWFAWGARVAGRRRAPLITAQLRIFRGDRDAVRRKAVKFALRGVLIQ